MFATSFDASSIVAVTEFLTSPSMSNENDSARADASEAEAEEGVSTPADGFAAASSDESGDNGREAPRITDERAIEKEPRNALLSLSVLMLLL